MTAPLFHKVTLIGIGLIGSSLARVIRERHIATHIAISTRSEKTLALAESLALGDEYSTDAAEMVRGADLVIVSVPVGASGAVAKAIAGDLKEGAIVTDVGSTKVSVIAQMAPEIPSHAHFIAGHPIAGTEHSGPEAGFSTLFDKRWCILTPSESQEVDQEALGKLTEFWTLCGSHIDVMTPEYHDRVLAITSHLPQLIAYNIVGTADDLEADTKSEVIKYSASGFRDFTRLAASDPIMWRDVCLHNKDAILEMLTRFSEDLSSLQKAVRRGDSDKLEALFTRTRAIRREVIEAGQDVPTPNFGRNDMPNKEGPNKDG